MNTDEVRAVLASAEAATPGPWERGPYPTVSNQVKPVAHTQAVCTAHSQVAEGGGSLYDAKANAEFIAAANPAAVAALCRRVLELERGLFEWHRVVDVGGETPRCRGCGASPIFTGADPRSMPVHAADCWVAALLANGGDGAELEQP